ncbi:MAG: TRAP transporter small permease [Ignavibacteria bacterium]|nr:TRAP transporter small permease [Ignavibacteria bacterium]
MKIRSLIDKTLEFLLILFLSALVIDVIWQVFSRYILNSPSSFTDELARVLLIWVGILSSAYATGKKMHLAIDILLNKLNAKNVKLANIVINLLVAAFALTVMVIGGGNLIYILLKLGNITPALSLPMGYLYSVIPISGMLIIYYSLYDIFSENTTEETLQSSENPSDLARQSID